MPITSTEAFDAVVVHDLSEEAVLIDASFEDGAPAAHQLQFHQPDLRLQMIQAHGRALLRQRRALDPSQ